MSEEKEDQDIPVNINTLSKQHHAERRKVNGNAFTEVLQTAQGEFQSDKGDLLCNLSPSSGQIF